MSQCSAPGKQKKGTLFLKKEYKAIFSPGAKDWLQSHSWTLSPRPKKTSASPLFQTLKHVFRFKTKLIEL